MARRWGSQDVGPRDGSTAHAESGTPPLRSPARIAVGLVVDDPARAREVEQALARDGHAVRRLSDGASLASADVEVAIVDAGPPPAVRSGVLVLALLPVDSDAAPFIAAGFDDVLRMPFSAEELLSRIRLLAALRRSNAQVAVLEQQAATAAGELDALAAAVSHDLRAPVRAIEGFTDLLISEHGAQLAGAAGNLLLRVRGAALRMGQLIDGMVAFTRANRVKPSIEPVDLSSMATEIAERLRAGSPQREVEVVIEPGLHALGDSRLLRSVMENLLGNAWKYTSANRSARIEVGEGPAGPGTGFFVKDDGAGFDMAHSGRLFRPFARLHTEREFPGVGMGLAMAERIVARHGGAMSAEAAPGRGATFYVTLPGPVPT